MPQIEVEQKALNELLEIVNSTTLSEYKYKPYSVKKPKNLSLNPRGSALFSFSKDIETNMEMYQRLYSISPDSNQISNIFISTNTRKGFLKKFYGFINIKVNGYYQRGSKWTQQ